MLHEIPCPTTLSAPLKEFLHALDIGGFVGDISTEFADRVVASTDNSIWQRTPEAVLSPRTHEDIVFVLKLLGQESFRNINITARGAGTSTAGQTLTHEIVLDCKRYFNEIISYDSTRKQVTVEPGAVLATVNHALQEYGVMIGPTVATATRATIGGMIGNDSAGKGSTIYGKMSDCIVELKTVLVGGKTILTKALQNNDVASLEQTGSFYGLLLQSVRSACDLAQPKYEECWPTIPRFVSGYNLPMAWDGETCDLNRILCGAEGTLGVTTLATLQCVDIPKNRELLLLGFSSFDDALVCGNSIREFQPSAVECVDEMVLDSARNDACWESVEKILGENSSHINALLFVEFIGVSSRIHEACLFSENQCNATHSVVINDKDKMNTAWDFRSKSVGILSAIDGNKQPVPFVEDCAVPPDSLSQFIQDFRAILDTHGLRAGMFGHVDAGVIHVRPALDMKLPTDRALVQIVTNDVASLVTTYGGVLWGEHGKGFRSTFGPSIFGDDIWEQICAIKKLFDPYNQLNPGKVAVPESTFKLTGIDEGTRGEHDASLVSLPMFDAVKRCDGNSECQSVIFESNMCPTYRATGDPIHSPRGRSELLRAWLGKVQTSNIGSGSFFKKIWATRSTDDLSHEVFEALEGCLSCKACSTECPMQIDIPTLRSEFYSIYFGRYFRP
ncbi:MAG: FAD-binding oxidoreductase, partial [Phycisphaerae bacterium]|nr:FAD-binding oxidoreductase [Phycisphaerae bacterium]